MLRSQIGNLVFNRVTDFLTLVSSKYIHTVVTKDVKSTEI